MATPLPYSQAVDIGGGRGRLAPAAAASLRRLDARIGHLWDINEAWRSPEQADANYAAYVAYRNYQNGGPFAPWAPIALPANASIHCIGYAIDTDEQIVWLLNENGWFQTVYRNGQLVEPWHFEYDYSRDQYRNESAGGGAVAFPTEDDMPLTPADAELVATTILNKLAYDFAVRADVDGGQPLTVSQWLKDIYEVQVFGGTMNPDNKRPARESLDGIVDVVDELRTLVKKLPTTPGTGGSVTGNIDPIVLSNAIRKELNSLKLTGTLESTDVPLDVVPPK